MCFEETSYLYERVLVNCDALTATKQMQCKEKVPHFKRFGENNTNLNEVVSFFDRIENQVGDVRLG